MDDKLKVDENGYSLITGVPVYQIANAEDEVVDVGPYSKKEADAALKELSPNKAEAKKEDPVKKAPAKKTTKK